MPYVGSGISPTFPPGLLNQQMSSAEIGTADFFCNIDRFFCWIHRLFVNSTDEPVKSTDMSVKIADFKKKEKSVIHK